jgi:phage terminase large subunit-like protein
VDRVPYTLWAEQGYLELTQGKVIKLPPIAQKMAWVADNFDLRSIAYDNYRHRELQDDLLDLGIELPMVEHPQGFRRSGDSELWMPTSVQEIENAIIEERLKVCANPLLRYNVAQTVIRYDPAGTDNKIFDKRKSRARIDGIVASAMAVGAAAVRQEPVFGVPLQDILETA